MTTTDRLSHFGSDTLDTRGRGTGEGFDAWRGLGGGKGETAGHGRQGLPHRLGSGTDPIAAFDRELERIRLAWAGKEATEEGPSPEGQRREPRGERLAGDGSPDRHDVRGRERENGAHDWLKGLDALPILAQSAGYDTLSTLFRSAGGPVETTHPVTSQADELIRRLVERVEPGPADKAGAARIEVSIALERLQFGLSGMALKVAPEGVSVVLVGVSDPASEGLAAASQMLLRELQKHFPNRPIRVLARSEGDGDTGHAADEVAPSLRPIRRNEFTEGRDP